MVSRIDNNILYLSIFDTDDLSFLILNERYNNIIVKTISNIILVDELFIQIKLYEDNDILEVIT